MEPITLAARVEILEQMVAGLQDLPGRMRAVEGRLFAVEGRLGAVEGRLTSVESQIVQLRVEMQQGFLQHAEMMDVRFAQAKSENLMLYEDLKDSIRTLGEGGFRRGGV